MLVFACPTFPWQREESKGHYSKESNCVGLVRKICILSLPCCIPQRESLVFQFHEKYPSFEIIQFYIFPYRTRSLAPFCVNPTFPLLLESLKSLSSSGWCKTMHIYSGGSLFQFSCQSVCLHNELSLRHFRFQQILSIRCEETKFYQRIKSLFRQGLQLPSWQYRERSQALLGFLSP